MDYPSVNQFREALGLAIAQLVLDGAKSVKEKDKAFKSKVKPYSPVQWDQNEVGQYNSVNTKGDGEKPSPIILYITQVTGMPVTENTASAAQTLASSIKTRKNRVAYFVVDCTLPPVVSSTGACKNGKSRLTELLQVGVRTAIESVKSITLAIQQSDPNVRRENITPFYAQKVVDTQCACAVP